MQINELVTVVVPVYNVEPYLDRCMTSIVNQTYRNIQIIIIDDGSTDNSPFICDKWAKMDERIEVIHKINTGLGLTRNEGLKKAKGKYICFIDSDDYIHQMAIEKVYLAIKEKDADICYYGCVDVIDGIESTKQPPKKLFYLGSEVKREFAASLIGNAPGENGVLFTGMSSCYAFYKVELLHNNSIKFHSEREKYISEDLIFNLTACLFAEKVSILPESLYYYVIRRKDSLRSSYRSDRFEKSKFMYDKLLEFSDVLNLGSVGKFRADRYFLQTVIVCSKMELLNKKPKREVLQTLRSYISDQTIKDIVKQYPLKRLPWKQRIFTYCIRYRNVYAIYILSAIQNRKLNSIV